MRMSFREIGARLHHLLRGRRGVLVAAALAVLAALAGAHAYADALRSTGCVGAGLSFNCVTTWRWNDPLRTLKPEDPRLAAEAAERERKWLARCKPVVRQDQYGVGRYVYAAPGCEYGKHED
jgi:hypothetical protein